MNGQDVLRARKALGWHRAQLGEKVGLTHGQIAGIENGRKIRPEEEERLKEVLRVALGEVVVKGTAESPAAREVRDTRAALGDEAARAEALADPDAEVVLETWRGLTKGDACKLEGDKPRSRFEFLRYRRTPTAEYVELRAPNGNVRTVRPDRVRDVKGRPLLEVVT